MNDIETEEFHNRFVDLETDFLLLLEHLGLEIHEFKYQRTGMRDNPWIMKKTVVVAPAREK